MAATESDHWHIEPLAKNHDRGGFACGQPALDNYLQTRINQDLRRNLARAFVLCRGQSYRVLGFYTISALSIDAETLPDSIKRKLPMYPVPAALIGRLAIDRSIQGKGLGKILLADAIKRIAETARTIGILAIIVEAKDNQAMAFYSKFGFQILEASSSRLFLPLKAIVP